MKTSPPTLKTTERHTPYYIGEMESAKSINVW